MKLTKEAIISIIVVILFVGSIFGFALSGQPPETNNNPDDENSQIDPDAPAKLYATTIDSNILDIYPQLIIVANSTEYEVDVIDAKLREINGIKSPNISFNKNEKQEVIMVSRMTIDSEVKEDIINKINSIDFLSEIELYQTALLSLPTESITLYSDDNSTRDYQFTNIKMEGIVGIDSLIDDMISAQLQMVFKGDLPVNAQLFEYQNLSSNPQMIVDEINLDINGWEDNYLVTADSEINIEFDDNQVIEIFSDLNLTSVIYIDGSLDYILDENTESIENYLTEQKDKNQSIISDYQITDGNVIKIYFKPELAYLDYTDLLLGMEENEYDSNKITSTPIRKYNLDIIDEKIDIELITNRLLENSITLDNISKKAIFNTKELEINNKTYFYDENISYAWLEYPEDIELENIDLTIQGYATRDKFLFIQLNKKIEEN